MGGNADEWANKAKRQMKLRTMEGIEAKEEIVGKQETRGKLLRFQGRR